MIIPIYDDSEIALWSSPYSYSSSAGYSQSRGYPSSSYYSHTHTYPQHQSHSHSFWPFNRTHSHSRKSKSRSKSRSKGSIFGRGHSKTTTKPGMLRRYSSYPPPQTTTYDAHSKHLLSERGRSRRRSESRGRSRRRSESRGRERERGRSRSRHPIGSSSHHGYRKPYPYPTSATGGGVYGPPPVPLQPTYPIPPAVDYNHDLPYSRSRTYDSRLGHPYSRGYGGVDMDRARPDTDPLAQNVPQYQIDATQGAGQGGGYGGPNGGVAGSGYGGGAPIYPQGTPYPSMAGSIAPIQHSHSASSSTPYPPVGGLPGHSTSTSGALGAVVGNALSNHFGNGHGSGNDTNYLLDAAIRAYLERMPVNPGWRASRCSGRRKAVCVSSRSRVQCALILMGFWVALSRLGLTMQERRMSLGDVRMMLGVFAIS